MTGIQIRAPTHVETQVSTPQVKLEEVSFDDNYALRKDDDSDSFRKPHWETSADPNYKGEPVAYEDGKKMKVGAKFSLSADVVPTEKILVKADGNADYDIQAAPAKYDKKEKRVELNATASNTLFPKDTIDYFEAMALNWQVALDGVKFEDAGSSSNQVYVTLSKPVTPFHTTVHLATKNLKGLKKDNPAEIVSRIWSEFTDRRMYLVSDVGQTMPLQYWGVLCYARPGEGAPPPVEVRPCFQSISVVKNRDARCGGWQGFLIDVLKTQGITATPYDIVPKPRGSYPFKGLVVKSSSPGQGNDAPQNQFSNHALVKYGGRIYDPSYGRDFDNLKLWENFSLDYVFYKNRRDGPDDETKPNDPNTEEMQEYVPPPTPLPGP